MSVTQTEYFNNDAHCLRAFWPVHGGGRGERKGGRFWELEVGGILGGSFPGATSGGYSGVRSDCGRLPTQRQQLPRASIQMNTHPLGRRSQASFTPVPTLSLRVGVLLGHGGRVGVVAIGQSRP